jgi:uncharacterized protein
MTRIDVHVHPPVAEWLGGSIAPYLDSLERYFRREVTARPIEDLAAEYERLDMVAVLLAWDAETATGCPPLTNELVSGIVERFADRFVGFGSVDPHKRGARDQVRRLPDLGLIGLKLHPTAQAFDPSSDDAMPIFEAAAEAGLTILSHSGTSGLGARCPGGQGLRIDFARPVLLDRAAAAFPELPIVLAHVGWPWHLEALAMALHKTNVLLDVSGWRARYLPPEVIREMKGRLADQFLFGTDAPLFSPASALEELEVLELADDALAKIVSTNAQRILSSLPRGVTTSPTQP